MSEYTDGYADGYEAGHAGGFEDGEDYGFAEGQRKGETVGYHRGEFERIALATANGELRSEILQLRNRLAEEVQGWGP